MGASGFGLEDATEPWGVVAEAQPDEPEADIPIPLRVLCGLERADFNASGLSGLAHEMGEW